VSLLADGNAARNGNINLPCIRNFLKEAEKGKKKEVFGKILEGIEKTDRSMERGKGGAGAYLWIIKTLGRDIAGG